MRSAKLKTGTRGVRYRLLAALLLLPLPLSAAPKSVPSMAMPDPASNPAVAALIKSGAKFFYLGNTNGIDGWLVNKDGQMQVLYKPANSAYVMMGHFLNAKGQPVTPAQMKTLADGNRELASLVAAENPAPPAPPASPQPTLALNAAQDSAVATEASADATLPPGERLMKEVGNTPGITLGPEGAPELFVFMSPDDKASKAFWEQFRDSVQKGAVSVRLLPVAPPETEHERSAAELLYLPNAMEAWDKFAGGDASAFAGTPDPASVAAVRVNTALGARWQLPAIPYILYRARDGQVKVIQGVPVKPQAIISDIAVEKTGSPAP